jgi:glycosyltransferase involved in cell wall biosynthesis
MADKYVSINFQEYFITLIECPFAEKYIIQVARFDPAKGIPDVIESYAEFRRRLAHHSPHEEAPQLVMYTFFVPPLPSSTNNTVAVMAPWTILMEQLSTIKP